MSKKTDNLVEIAKILIELREERNLNNVPAKVMSRYPEGSQGIVINGDKFVVLNNKDSDVVSNSEGFNIIKDSNLKYNPNFYLSTYESDEPDIIDEAHNKSKLINEAYTEVSFLPKDIYSQAEFDPVKGQLAMQNIIDKKGLNKTDFDDYRVEKPKYNYGDVYDEIFRCRCVFYDITGNESIESLLIKAYKVSNIKGEEYSYNIVNSEEIKQYIEELENKVTEDDSGELRAVYSKISSSEYENIEKRIKEGVEKFYQENSHKYYRLTRVDIKAIYCLRLRKNPIELNLFVDNSPIAKLSSYYSMVAGDLNVFTCPHCNTLSSDINHYDGLKIHVDHDFTDIEEDFLLPKMPIGCTECMEKCSRCGRWHFKLSDYSKVLSKGYNPINSRKFLKNYAKTDLNSENYCSCKEYLTWIYDDMTMVNKNGKVYFEDIIDKFLSGSCKATFINYLTGELIASYKDYILYLNEYLITYLKNETNVYRKFMDQTNQKNDYDTIKDRIYNFVERYIINEDNEFGDFDLPSYISQSIVDFKKGVADIFNISPELIKMTNSKKSEECSSCKAHYYSLSNNEGEVYYNSVKKLCYCCDEAISKNYKLWNRIDDGVTFYKPKNKSITVRTFNSSQGEELFETWKRNALNDLIKKIRKTKNGEKK